MMNHMNTPHIFSIHRVGHLLQRDLIENQKTYIRTYAGILLALLLVFFMKMESVPVFEGDWGVLGDGAYFAARTARALCMVFIALAILMPSCMLAFMKTKEQRIANLMVPATNFEKFFSRWILCTVVPMLATIVLIAVADVFHMFLHLFIGTSGVTDQWVFPAFLQRLLGGFVDMGSVHPVIAKLFALVMFLWAQSLYLWGGCRWTKNPFLKTLGLHFVVILLLVMGMGWLSTTYMDLFMAWGDMLREFCHTHPWLNETFITLVATVIFFWFTVLNYWLSYRMFTRVQIIRPKFLGL